MTAPPDQAIRRLRTVAASLLLTLLVAACGGGTGNGFNSALNAANAGAGSGGAGGGAGAGNGSGSGGGSGTGTGGGTGAGSGSGKGSTLSLLAGITVGSGSSDGPGATALLNAPRGLAADPSGNVYFADNGNHTIRRISPSGVVSTLAGTPGVPTPTATCTPTCTPDGTGAGASFNNPSSVAYDAISGALYVADTGNSTIRKITLPGGVVTTFAGTTGVNNPSGGSVDGPYGVLSQPVSVATDSNGNVWVVDILGYTVIRRIVPTPGGPTQSTISTIAGGGNQRVGRVSFSQIDGIGSAAAFSQLSQQTNTLTFDPGSGNLLVADTGNNAIRAVTPQGVVSTYAGNCPPPIPPAVTPPACASITGGASAFNSPHDVAIDGAGNLYVSDGSPVITRITPGGAATLLAGNAGIFGASDGQAGAASFSNSISGLLLDTTTAMLLVADSANNEIRSVDTGTGAVHTVAGVTSSGSTDGIGSAARFNTPDGIAVDAGGKLYVTDNGNHTIRLVTPGGTVSTLAGTAGVQGFSDSSAPPASFSYPQGIARDASSGVLYVADSGNLAIRMISPSGVVSTYAGSGSGDGVGIAAGFGNPVGVTVDAGANLYVSDQGNNCVRKIAPGAVVTTLAGVSPSDPNFTGASGAADGTGPGASFNQPGGIAYDNASGNLYVSDSGNSTIRRITAGGVVTTLAGTAGTVGAADGTGPAASFSNPQGLTVDASGNIYVADLGNGLIRKITPAGLVSTISVLPGSSGGLPVRLDTPVGLALYGRTLYVTTGNGIVYISDVP